MKPLPEKLPDLSDFLSYETPDVPRGIVCYVAQTFGQSAALLLLDIDGLYLHPTAVHPPILGEQDLLEVNVSLMELGDHTLSTAIFDRRTVTMPGEEWAGLVPMEGAHLAVTPVRMADEVIGVLVTASDEPFSGEALGVLEKLATQAGAALIIAERYADAIWRARRRIRPSIAAQVQQDLLPPQEHYTPQVSVAGRIEPAYDVGGDWYDYALIKRDELYVAVGDPAGKGLKAEALANISFGATRNARRDRMELTEIVSMVDRAVREVSSPEQYVTLLLARIDLDTREMELVNAGHPAPVFVPEDPGEPPRLLKSSRLHPPVGALGDEEASGYEPEKHQLGSGRRLLFYTDGVTERRNERGDLLGTEGLLRFMESFRHLEPLPFVHGLLQELVNYGENPMTDDATVVLVELR